jgi:hypothetical protein
MFVVYKGVVNKAIFLLLVYNISCVVGRRFVHNIICVHI